MREFDIRLTSVQDVLDFVSLATSRGFPIKVGNSHHQVNGKSFMEMFCLNFHFPLLLCWNAPRKNSCSSGRTLTALRQNKVGSSSTALGILGAGLKMHLRKRVLFLSAKPTNEVCLRQMKRLRHEVSFGHEGACAHGEG